MEEFNNFLNSGNAIDFKPEQPRKELTWEEELELNMKDMETSDEDESAEDPRVKQSLSKDFAPVAAFHESQLLRFGNLSPLAQLAIYEGLLADKKSEGPDPATHTRRILVPANYQSIETFRHQRAEFLAYWEHIDAECQAEIQEIRAKHRGDENMLRQAKNMADERMKQYQGPHWLKIKDAETASSFCLAKKLPTKYVDEWV